MCGVVKTGEWKGKYDAKRVKYTSSKEIKEKDKDLLNNYLVSMIFYDIA